MYGMNKGNQVYSQDKINNINMINNNSPFNFKINEMGI